MTATAKREAAARRRQERRAQRARRLEVWSCFWTWPFGHRYETSDGRGSLEAHAHEGMIPELYCVGCGRPYGLFREYT